MARTNKYTSINFNHVVDKNISTSASTTNSTKQSSSSSSSSYSSIASPNNNNKTFLPSSRTHGRMLVLTKPTPKPTPKPVTSYLPSPPPSLQPQNSKTPDPDQTDPGSQFISLRPLGRTGTASESFAPVLVQEREKEVGSLVVSPKPDKFVPPHLRPGFVGREERPSPEVLRARESGQRHFMSSGGYGEDGRPKSGGYERTMRGGESDLGLVNRPRSSGNRPSYTE